MQANTIPYTTKGLEIEGNTD